MKTTHLILVVIIGLLIGAGIAVVAKDYIIPTTGTVKTIGVSITWQSDGTEVTSLDWRLVDNATAYYMDPINITNIKNVPATLSLTYNDTSDSIIDLKLTWDYHGTVLAPTESILVVITQNITATGPFTYNTIITATEAT